MALKIAINTRLLLKDRLEGIGNFTFQSIQHMAKNHPEVEFHLLFDQPFSPEMVNLPNTFGHVYHIPTRLPILIKLWMAIGVKKLLSKIQPDVFVSPDSVYSLNLKIPGLYVLHDINFHHRPFDLPKKWAKFYNQMVPRYLGSATRIATVSEYSKQDIENTYQIDSNKIDVVYNGVDPIDFMSSSEQIKAVKDHFGIIRPYFFYIGSLHPRKNLEGLLEGFAHFKETTNRDFQLVIGGNFLFGESPLFERSKKLGIHNNLIITGRLSNSELAGLMNGAEALTFVPFFEGFGIPIIEAFACNTPVITSNTTSLPEIAQDAALLVDPKDTKAIGQAMVFLTQNPGVKEELIKKGKKRAEQFTWERTAQLLWESIQKTLHNGTQKF